MGNDLYFIGGSFIIGLLLVIIAYFAMDGDGKIIMYVVGGIIMFQPVGYAFSYFVSPDSPRNAMQQSASNEMSQPTQPIVTYPTNPERDFTYTNPSAPFAQPNTQPTPTYQFAPQQKTTDPFAPTSFVLPK
jgi:hypothetical protein